MNKLIFLLFLIIFTKFIPVELSVTRILNNNYQFLTPKILKQIEIRPRRWTEQTTASVLVSIENWICKIQLNKHLIVSSNFSFNWITHDNDTSIRNVINPENCQVLEGVIVNNENSRVIMTICDDNFYGFIQINDQSFVVQPSNNGSHLLQQTQLEMKNFATDNTRKIKRNVAEFYNLTGDTLDLTNDIGPINVIDRESSSSTDGNEDEDDYHSGANYFTDQMRIRSDELPTSNFQTQDEMTNPPRWLELGIAVDYSVIEFHGERVQQYVLALLNIVSAIYKDPSLNTNLTIVITRMVFYVEKKDGKVRQGNAKKSLENVNKWNRQVVLSTNKTHDVAVWLTRLDIGGPSGYAPVSGACDPARSCALNRDEGLTSAFIIAHELAHILGLTHDGDETANNSCGQEASMGSIMAPMVAATFHRFRWSSCSRDEFHRRAKKWKCLNNHPNVDNATHLKATLHDTFTMDEQCRMEFGEGYQLCRSLDLLGSCSHLWCGHKSAHQVCKTKKGPPLDGTACGKNKWCVNGNCETIDHSISTIDADVINNTKNGWSDWGAWSECSTTCGIGVQFRYRQCSLPQNANCPGGDRDFIICNLSSCPVMTDRRREQCAIIANLIGLERMSGRYRTAWLPHETDDTAHKCHLTCRNSESGRIYMSENFLHHGTPCSYSTTDICVHGQCYPMGCDNILNSTKQLDNCGVCDGDNSTCISISNKYQRKIRRVNVRIAVIPSSSYDVTIEVEIIPPIKSDNIKLVLRDAHRRKYCVTSYESQRENNRTAVRIVEGMLFKVETSYDVYKISGRGRPTLAEVVVSLKVTEHEVKRGSIVFVNFRYVTNRGENSRNTYNWSIGGWSPCSVSCGGGVRQRTIACKNEQNGRIENNRRCAHLMKPAQNKEKCNVFSCQFKWIHGPWEGCSQTCGNNGIQQRQIYCVHSSISDNEITRTNAKFVYRLMLPWNICKKYYPPETQRVCNKIPCPGNWIFTDWSPCSRSCGRGVQSRMARCVSLDGESHFDCNGTNAPDELRPCRGHGHNYYGCETFCRQDKSHYCILPSLKKYCQIPQFKRHCCRACSQNGNNNI